MIHQLYRIHDRHGRLLYVGISNDLARRLGQHAHAKPWWDQIENIQVTHYPNRASVAAAEILAIATEHPLHNVVHRPKTTRLTPSPPLLDPPYPVPLTLGDYVQLRLTSTPQSAGVVVQQDGWGLVLESPNRMLCRVPWPTVLEVWHDDGRVITATSSTVTEVTTPSHAVIGSDR